jgi:hypothetical protein
VKTPRSRELFRCSLRPEFFSDASGVTMAVAGADSMRLLLFKPTFRQTQGRYDQLCGVANTIVCFVGNIYRATSTRRVAAAAKGRGAYTYQRIQTDLWGVIRP